jgi:hypothetical protein
MMRIFKSRVRHFIGPDFLTTPPNTHVPPVKYLFERCRSSDEVREQPSQELQLPPLQDRRRLDRSP